MPFSEESAKYFASRNIQLASLKHNTKIGIFGSFYMSRKDDLLSLKKFLCDNGYNARISEDLDTRLQHERKARDPAYDRKLSDELINTSDIFLFILPREHDGDPPNLIQSVSMEIERLHTLSECGQKSEKYVAVFIEEGLRGKMGGVCEGLLGVKTNDWSCNDFKDIQEIFKPARQFCMNCIQDMYCY